MTLKINPVTGQLDLIGKGGGSDLASVIDLIDLIDENNSVEFTTSSASFVTLLSSALTTFTGDVVLFLLNMSAFRNANKSIELELAIQIDNGADVVIGSHFFNITNTHMSFGFTLIQTPSAGDHIINLRWRKKHGGAGQFKFDFNDNAQLKAIQF